MFKEGHLDHRNFSNTPTLIRTLLIRVDQLMRVTLDKDVSVEDAYQALGMASELLDDVDKLFCGLYYDQIPEGRPPKSFEELTGKLGKPVKAKAMAAANK
jgi:hypothetical protein